MIYPIEIRVNGCLEVVETHIEENFIDHPSSILRKLI